MDSTVRCLFPELPPLVGYAIPIRVRTSDPPIGGRATSIGSIGGISCWRCPSRGSWSWRTCRAMRARARSWARCTRTSTGHSAAPASSPTARCATCRRCAQLSFQAFAAHVSVSHAYAHVIEVGSPVDGGRTGSAALGDLLHGRSPRRALDSDDGGRRPADHCSRAEEAGAERSRSSAVLRVSPSKASSNSSSRYGARPAPTPETDSLPCPDLRSAFRISSSWPV